VRIVADLGGTNARLAALDGGGRPGPVLNLRCAEFAGPAEVVMRFLAERRGADDSGPHDLVLAIAGPVRGETLAPTNLAWRFSRAELRSGLELGRLEILNDFEALARAIPLLADGDRLPVRRGAAALAAPIVVLGPGTGLGVAALVPVSPADYVVLDGEGGHRDLAAANAAQWEVTRRLGERFGHVSAERVLSGPGLENLHSVLAEFDGYGPLVPLSAEKIAAAARRGDPRAVRATHLFSSWLGAFAGDLALTFGARGGVYLAGGVLAGLGEAFDTNRFRRRFVEKGRMSDYLEPIPVWRIVRPDAALLGCAAVLHEGDEPHSRA
jgi:glucokinase